MTDAKLEFLFDGLPVGVFEEPEFPKCDGRYHYMPYRGPGHYEMQTALQKSGSARCSYKDADGRTSFTVMSCPAYGILELSGFKGPKRRGK